METTKERMIREEFLNFIMRFNGELPWSERPEYEPCIKRFYNNKIQDQYEVYLAGRFGVIEEHNTIITFLEKLK